MVHPESSFPEAEPRNVSQCHIAVDTGPGELKVFRTVPGGKLKVFQDIVENQLAVVAAGIDNRVVGLKISVYPRDVSKRLEFSHVGICPPEACNAHVMVPPCFAHAGLGLVHALDHVVALPDEAEVRACPAASFVGAPDSRMVDIRGQLGRAEIRVSVVPDSYTGAGDSGVDESVGVYTKVVFRGEENLAGYPVVRFPGKEIAAGNCKSSCEKYVDYISFHNAQNVMFTPKV